MELNYGVEMLTCADAVTRAVPEDFTPGEKIEVSWEWDMYQSGSIPTGTTVWWQWVLVDELGQQFETDIKTLRFDDTNHPWQLVQSENIDLYYYQGSPFFAEELITAGEDALLRIEDLLGYRMDGTVQMYIYASPQDMQRATLYTMSWVGGYAQAEYRLLVIGIPPDQLEWGKSSVAHELAHIATGRMAFSCVTRVPYWLDEGIAMIIDGRSEYGTVQLQRAIETDSLLSIRQIEGYYSSDDETAILSYAQSLSLTHFLINEYGADAIRELLLAYKDGMADDEALMSVYGFDRDGLEVLWRVSIGADPPGDAAGDEDTEPTPTRTPYPTIAPLGVPVTQTPAEASTPTPPSTQTIAPTEPGEEIAAQPSATLATGDERNIMTSAGRLAKRALPYFLIIVGIVVAALIGGGVVLILRSQKHS